MLNEIVTTAMAVTTAMDTAAKVTFGAKVGKFIADNRTAVIATGVGVGCAGAATAITLNACRDEAANDKNGRWSKAIKHHKNTALYKAFHKETKEEKSDKDDSEKKAESEPETPAEQMTDEDMKKAEADAAADKAATEKVVDVPVTQIKEDKKTEPCDPNNPDKIPLAG